MRGNRETIARSSEAICGNADCPGSSIPFGCLLGVEANSRCFEDLLRYHVLVHVFGGSPARWLSYLEEQASARQRQSDLEFVLTIAAAVRRDAGLLDRIIRLVEATPLSAPPAPMV